MRVMCHIRSRHNILVIGGQIQVTRASSARTCACMFDFAGAVVCALSRVVEDASGLTFEEWDPAKDADDASCANDYQLE